jgi:hypothetical protein
MKKNIIIVALSIFFLISLTFGVYQKNRADKLEIKLSNELLMNEKQNKEAQAAFEKAIKAEKQAHETRNKKKL